jgi:putative ABC transport system permease protein
MSLGAMATDIRQMVLSAGAWATAAGLTAGLALTLVGLRFLSSQVFGLETGNVRAYVVAGCTLTLTALAASWLPARRAARVDPVRAIQTE